MKLLVAIPSNRAWEPDFGNSLIRLMIHTSHLNMPTTIHSLQGVSNIALGRQNALSLAIKEGFSHLLFVDDDVWFKAEALDFLFSRNKAFIAANIVKKPSVEMVMDKTFSPTPVSKNKDGSIIYSKDKHGVEKVDYTGLGFALINLGEIKKVQAPHFTGTDLSEDFTFCWKLAQNGIDVLIDHDATRFVAHIGRYPFSELTGP